MTEQNNNYLDRKDKNNIERLRELHKEATPGTWWVDGFDVEQSHGTIAECGDDKEYPGLSVFSPKIAAAGVGLPDFSDEQCENNAQLIALSRNMLPQFLELVDKSKSLVLELGMLKLIEPTFRQELGNTNYEVLQHHLKNVEVALAKLRGETK
jgi:hypothetical protein